MLQPLWVVSWKSRVTVIHTAATTVPMSNETNVELRSEFLVCRFILSTLCREWLMNDFINTFYMFFIPSGLYLSCHYRYIDHHHVWCWSMHSFDPFVMALFLTSYIDLKFIFVNTLCQNIPIFCIKKPSLSRLEQMHGLCLVSSPYTV